MIATVPAIKIRRPLIMAARIMVSSRNRSAHHWSLLSRTGLGLDDTATPIAVPPSFSQLSIADVSWRLRSRKMAAALLDRSRAAPRASHCRSATSCLLACCGDDDGLELSDADIVRSSPNGSACVSQPRPVWMSRAGMPYNSTLPLETRALSVQHRNANGTPVSCCHQRED